MAYHIVQVHYLVLNVHVKRVPKLSAGGRRRVSHVAFMKQSLSDETLRSRDTRTADPGGVPSNK
jgi:hypothetical protein